jgi:hypothetical protein
MKRATSCLTGFALLVGLSGCGSKSTVVEKLGKEDQESINGSIPARNNKMKIDFVRTDKEVRKYLDETLAEFAQKHPNVKINKIVLWGHGFLKISHVLLVTSDDDSVFGKRTGEYNDNEFGPGVRFDEWWPDFYAGGNDGRYEIQWPDGTKQVANQEEGDAFINKPFVALLKNILRDADFSHVDKGTPFVRAVQDGDSGEEEVVK